MNLLLIYYYNKNIQQKQQHRLVEGGIKAYKQHETLYSFISNWEKFLNNTHKSEQIFLSWYALENERLFQCHSALRGDEKL